MKPLGVEAALPGGTVKEVPVPIEAGPDWRRTGGLVKVKFEGKLGLELGNEKLT